MRESCSLVPSLSKLGLSFCGGAFSGSLSSLLHASMQMTIDTRIGSIRQYLPNTFTIFDFFPMLIMAFHF